MITIFDSIIVTSLITHHTLLGDLPIHMKYLRVSEDGAQGVSWSWDAVHVVPQLFPETGRVPRYFTKIHIKKAHSFICLLNAQNISFWRDTVLSLVKIHMSTF